MIIWYSNTSQSVFPALVQLLFWRADWDDRTRQSGLTQQSVYTCIILTWERCKLLVLISAAEARCPVISVLSCSWLICLSHSEELLTADNLQRESPRSGLTADAIICTALQTCSHRTRTRSPHRRLFVKMKNDNTGNTNYELPHSNWIK